LWSGVELFNTYGTSETWDASFYRVRNQDADARSIAIGTPVANAALYILDAHGQPVPPGVTGELHVGGLALAREYVSNPELTRARFIPNPFITDPGARLYRTGDLACYQADGNVILAGRADRQIKLRGLRIEAGDIEGRALEFTGVRQCALRLQQPVAGDPWLALYVVAAGALNTEDLRAYLQAGLPRALVPADICVLDSLPLTPSGKVDLHALPMMPAPVAVGNYVAPRNAVEEQLAMIWSRALGCDRVGVHDDFFMLRGHSLLAVQVIARICDEFAVELPLHALFEAPTVAGLARNISALRWTQTQHSSAANLPDEREVLRL
jgi:acyl carrier protein